MARKPMDRVKRGLNQVYAYYRHRCYSRDRYWGITLAEFESITSKPCYYCLRLPSNKTWEFFYSGLDRLDNAKGYHPKNVVPCCKECNSIKGEHLTSAEMLAAMKAVLKLREKVR